MPSKGKIDLRYAVEVIDDEIDTDNGLIIEGNIILPNIKKVFLADTGMELADFDLSGADIQIVAWDSECKWLMDYFAAPRGNGKVYHYIASEFFQREITDKEYKTYKAVFHGCVTGDHEVLTRDGWVRIDEYDEKTPLAVWDGDNKNVFFEIPKSFNRDFVEADEDLFEIKGSSFDFLGTQDHKFPYMTSEGKLCREEANKLPAEGYLLYGLDGKSFLDISKCTRSLVKHSGTKVYCPQTSTGYFMCKRNGHIYVTGNTNYGMGISKLAAMSRIPEWQAQQLQDYYFHLNPEVREWQKRIERDIKTKGFISNIFGRRGWFLNRNDVTLLNKAYAFIPQSSVSDVINRAMVTIDETLPEVQLLLNVHDSTVTQYPIEKAAYYRQKIKEAMMVELPYKRPLTIPSDGKFSTVSYGACK